MLNNSEWNYSGPKQNGKKEGLGKITWFNGSVFNGMFIMNRANGIGKYIDSNGAEFVGTLMINNVYYRGVRRQ